MVVKEVVKPIQPRMSKIVTNTDHYWMEAHYNFEGKITSRDESH